MPGAARELAAVAPDVTLWWCPLARTPDEVGRLAGWLSAAETARAARFGNDRLRHRWIAGRTTLRLVLGQALGVPPPAVAIRRGVRGRPELADREAAIDFNVSHTHDVAVIAVARNTGAGLRIGVDVERADRDVGADRLARKFLTERERASLAGLEADLRRRLFVRYWTCKEAMSKATGDGLIAPFGQLEVRLGDSPCLIAGPPPYLPQHWSLHPADVPEGWFATLAVWRRP